jgi:thiamine-phosphate pyrophosphorylase
MVAEVMNARSWRGHYAIVDPEHAPGGVLETARAILAGGCAVLQLRFKGSDDAEHLRLARALKGLAAEAGVPFVVNDRVDIALLAEADGLHLGQDDLPVAEARKLFDGPIGLSTHDLDQARDAVRLGADLIGFGPVFTTSSKEKPDPVVGLDGLGAVCAELGLPVVAIGGLTPERAAQAHRAGAPLVAAIGAVSLAADVRAAAEAMHRAGGPA